MGASNTCSFTLVGPAPVGGDTLFVTSSSAHLSVPPTAGVAGGSTSGSFVVTALSGYSGPVNVTVTEVKEETVCERVIVQVVDVDVAMAVGVHASEETSTAILKESVWVAPYPAAVKVTLREPPVIVPEVTVKFAEAEPAGTLTDVGALS